MTLNGPTDVITCHISQ